MRMLVADRRTVSAFHGMSAPARRLRRTIAGIGQSFGQPIDLETAVRVKHHLNNGRDFEPYGDRWSERGAKHPGAAPDRFHPE